MDNIKFIEQEIELWKANIRESFSTPNTMRFKLILEGLELALVNAKRPSNTQMQSEEGPCSYCGTHDELETLNLCSECVGALPR